ncbi:MAG: glutamine amidotransferase [Bifidobacteriaceae bacterium]|jgi:GMP synthase (glutamine-hydrolysing)|nr:glutamine amidotransferase [Bifidobacteriaceae bacterium]
MKRALAIRHVLFENLGLLEPLLTERGYAIEYLHAGLDHLTPRRLAEPDLLVVLGGPIGVYQEATYPFLTMETDAIGHRLALAKPTLGLCLGAQLMAKALGAAVTPGPVKEIGYGPVELTAAGAASPLGAIAGVPVLHWHGDGFQVPGGASRLAYSEHYEQAFGLDNWALALQFHLEVDPAWLETWLIGNCYELGTGGYSVPELRAVARQVEAALEPAGRAALGGWLDGL